jgi:hypothetical protein
MVSLRLRERTHRQPICQTAAFAKKHIDKGFAETLTANIEEITKLRRKDLKLLIARAFSAPFFHSDRPKIKKGEDVDLFWLFMGVF